ncbi:unnamed protein product [Camellia sinensis]
MLYKIVKETTRQGMIYHVHLRQAAWFSPVPWSMMAFVGYLAGVLSDMLIQSGMAHFISQNHAVHQVYPYLHSIGFVGPGIALIGLTMANHPSIAPAWLTLAVGLKSFSHCGFLVNLQQGFLGSKVSKDNLKEEVFHELVDRGFD